LSFGIFSGIPGHESSKGENEWLLLRKHWELTIKSTHAGGIRLPSKQRTIMEWYRNFHTKKVVIAQKRITHRCSYSFSYTAI
jgi:hypothetical protein